jgi:hypothetical protein
MSPAEKHQAHEMIEQLTSGQLAAIVQLLRVMTDPVTRAIANAPTDDEPLSTEGIRALDDAGEWSNEHQDIPHEQVLSELGISQEEIDRFNGSR